MKEIKLFETFAGIGSQYQALKNIAKTFDLNVVSLGAVEWYIDAIISYQIIHYGLKSPEKKLTTSQMSNILNKFVFSADSKKAIGHNYFNRISEKRLRAIFPYLKSFVHNFAHPLNGGGGSNFTDITQLENIPPDIDIFTYSFPCQDLSQQGKQLGLIKGSRSSLLFQVERILKNSSSLPKVLLLENVKALSHKKFSKEFNNWIKRLEQLGYQSSWKVLNAADYGSAQNRERLFMVSTLGDINKFKWPQQINTIQKNKMLENIIDNNKQDSSNKLNFILDLPKTPFVTNQNNQITKSKILEFTKFNSENFLYLAKGKGPTLTASGANSRLKFYFSNPEHIRYIDAIESYQYMGFDKKIALKVKNTNLISENKMIFTCGNSISVEVLEVLFKEIIKCLL